MTTLSSIMWANPILALVRLFTQNILTRGKMVLVLVLAAICVVLGIAIGRVTVVDPDDTSIEFVYSFGLALMVPILTLVVASSALGDLVEDESLVYVWMRPVGRLTISVSAWFASLLLALPVTVIPLTASVAFATSGNPKLMSATAGAVALAVIAYSGLFTLLGLLTRRALIVGLAYLFIWELFVARVGGGAAKLSISTYPSAALTKWSEVEPFGLDVFVERSLTAAVVVPIVVGLVSVFLTAFWLTRARVA